MFWSGKCRSRRAEIRKNRPDAWSCVWRDLRAEGTLVAIGIAMAFYVVTVGILMLREEVVPYRPGQTVRHDIVSRVDFTFHDKDRLNVARLEASKAEPRRFSSTADLWDQLQARLLELPDRVGTDGMDQVPADIRAATDLDPGALTALQQMQSEPRRLGYNEAVKAYVQTLRNGKIVILPAEQREIDLGAGRDIVLLDAIGKAERVNPRATFALPAGSDLSARLSKAVVGNFQLALQPKILAYTVNLLRATHELNEAATVEAQNRAAQEVPRDRGEVHFVRNQPLVRAGRVIEQDDWQRLRAENSAFAEVIGSTWKSKVGLALAALMVTLVLAGYIWHFQRRVVRNHARALAIAALLVSMHLLAQLAGIGNVPLYLFGVGPTLLVAIILATAYDQRFALGVATTHAVLVTLGLDQPISFFIVVWVGVLTCCFMLNDIRTRSKLIEVGGGTAVAMMLATVAAGAILMEDWRFIGTNCLYAGAAGLTVGFVCLGILPFIEKAFRITTSMTLLELADASHPLLRRLALEAPGTYNHSLQVAALSEAAAEAICGNSLLCRVASYYHDVGKINKADYFVENQRPGENRHLNLSPSVSLLIIIGHVKDGVELAKEYGLPMSILPFIQQHHGTTLVEYFYHQARTKGDAQSDRPQISETQYRYPGPKPRSKEVAIVMLADAVESATRAMPEPNASRIESLVHELSMRRLTDGQFDECDLTMRELELVERSLTKSLLAIYHGRIAYPSTSPAPSSSPAPALPGAVRTA